MLALCCWASLAWAQGPSGTEYALVIRVVDGDTVWLRSATRARIKARLMGVDAPERCQAYGALASAALQDLLLQRAVKVEFFGRDSYQRDLVRVYVDGHDVAAWMVRQGHAWSYRWRAEAGPYDDLEAQAKTAGRGLFADAQAMAPRDFRRQHGPCH